MLWNHGLVVESEVILRSAIEATICLKALNKLGSIFVELLRDDAIETTKRQIKMWRNEQDTEMVVMIEAFLRQLQSEKTSETSPRAFDWKHMADLGDAPDMYFYHRQLSGMSSHVTGLSIIRGIIEVNGEGKEEYNQSVTSQQNARIMLMTKVFLLGAISHARNINNDALEVTLDQLTRRLSARSWTNNHPK